MCRPSRPKTEKNTVQGLGRHSGNMHVSRASLLVCWFQCAGRQIPRNIGEDTKNTWHNCNKVMIYFVMQVSCDNQWTRSCYSLHRRRTGIHLAPESLQAAACAGWLLGFAVLWDVFQLCCWHNNVISTSPYTPELFAIKMGSYQWTRHSYNHWSPTSCVGWAAVQSRFGWRQLHTRYWRLLLLLWLRSSEA